MKKDQSKNISATHSSAPTPLGIMRQAFCDMKIAFEEYNDTLVTRLRLDTFETCVICWGQPNDLVIIVVRFPVSAAPEYRAATGEFLHRLNFNTKRKYWELDYDDGEVRLAAYTDTLLGPLTDRFFCSMFQCLLMTADAVFPYLSSVLTGRMTPDFADDQAEAALAALWNKG